MKEVQEGRRSRFGSALTALYGASKSARLRTAIRSLVLRLEGGAVYSWTIREIYKRYHGVDVGLYSIGPCNVPPGNLPPGTVVGRYCSIYYTVKALASESPTNHHNLFPKEALSPDPTSTSDQCDLKIGNDVFIGHNAIILPSTKEIGDGAVIGAGSVVGTPIPPYAVVTGNPARVVRFRFSEKTIGELLAGKWWLKSIDEISQNIGEFQKPLEGDAAIR